jgi:hypothetical protein
MYEYIYIKERNSSPVYYIVRSIKFVTKVGAGSANACLVLNYRDKRHI